jgi:hypothetical protein
MSDSERLIHTTESSTQIEIPETIMVEIAMRLPSDASRTEVLDALVDHVTHEIEYTMSDGRNAVDAILDDRELPVDMNTLIGW